MKNLAIAMTLLIGLSAYADDLGQQIQRMKEQQKQLEIEHAKSEAKYQAQMLEMEVQIKQLELKEIAEEAKKAVEDQGQLPDDAKKQLEKLQGAVAEYVKWAKERLEEGVKKAADQLKQGQQPPEDEKPAVHEPKKNEPKKNEPKKVEPKAAPAGQDLYKQGVKAYDAQKFEEGAKLFQQSAEAKYEQAGSYYNEACCWALAGNADKAVEALSKSIDAGYDDVDHLTDDSDLASLHDNAKFQELVKKLGKK